MIHHGANSVDKACAVAPVFGMGSVMSFAADLFWSFRSPYSYLAIGRYRALAASHDLTINLRPVYPRRRDDLTAVGHDEQFPRRDGFARGVLRGVYAALPADADASGLFLGDYMLI